MHPFVTRYLKAVNTIGILVLPRWQRNTDTRVDRHDTSYQWTQHSI